MSTVNAGVGTLSDVADGGIAHVFDTVAAYTSGKLASFQNNSVEKGYVDFEGSYFGHDGIFGGLVTVGETLAVAGVATFAGGLDGVIGGVTPAAGAFTTGSFTSNVTMGEDATASTRSLSLNTAAGEIRRIRFLTAGNQRWNVRANGTAEGGSNAGSDLNIIAYNDAGSAIGTALTIARSTMAAAFAGILSTTDATDATSATAAALKSAGGIAAVKGQWIGGTSRLVGAVQMDSTLTVTGAFGCNGQAAQTAYASGGALAGYATGAFGLDSDANMSALHALVVAMRAVLVANGIMS